MHVVSPITLHALTPPRPHPTPPSPCLPPFSGAYEHLDKITKRLINGILDAAKETGHGARAAAAVGLLAAAASCCSMRLPARWLAAAGDASCFPAHPALLWACALAWHPPDRPSSAPHPPLAPPTPFAAAMCGGSISGMFGFFFCDGPVHSFEDAKAAGGGGALLYWHGLHDTAGWEHRSPVQARCWQPLALVLPFSMRRTPCNSPPPTPTHRPCCADTAKFGRFHRGMLEHGVYLAPSQFEAGFTSLAHTEADIDATIEAARAVLKSL